LAQLDGCNTVDTGLPVIDVIVLVLHSFHCILTWSLESGISFRDQPRASLTLARSARGFMGNSAVLRLYRMLGKRGRFGPSQ
jgi:hypothetical protein